MAELQVLKGLRTQRTFPIAQDRMRLGRDPACEIHLEPKCVSRCHAELTRSEKGYCLVDCQSRHGTYLNALRMTPLVPYPLRDRDLINICDFCFAFRTSSSDFWRDTPATHALTADVESFAESDSSSTVVAGIDASERAWQTRASADAAVKLRAVCDIAHALNTTLTLDELLAHVLDILLATFPQADRAVIVLPDKESGEPVTRALRNRESGTHAPAYISRTIVKQVMAKQEALMADDVSLDSTLCTTASVVVSQIQSVLCAPLLDTQGRSLGAIQVDTLGHLHRFSVEELDLLAIVAMQVSFAIGAARRHAEVVDDTIRQTEMDIARQVQMSLLPSAVPAIAEYDFYDFYVPAREVGGDFYDYQQMPCGQLAVTIGDVSGKGVPASLLMANLSSRMQAYLKLGMEPLSVMHEVNVELCEKVTGNRFVTLLLLLLDPTHHSLQIINAGHWPPLLRSPNGEVRICDRVESSVPLGVDRHTLFHVEDLSIQPGEVLVLFTDGVLDAGCSSGNCYSLERVQKTVAGATGNATQIGRRLVDDVLGFAANERQFDDICVVCFGRLMGIC